MHKSLLTIFLLFVTVLSGIGQNLSVRSLELDAMDLTARRPVYDRNGVPCALLKVQMLDRVAKAEGNVIKRVDNGTETWLYLTEGTKMVKIIGEKHKPLMVNLSEWFPKGLEKKMTYILELDSDLPPEVLLSQGKKEMLPVAMSAATEPLLPEWWNTAAESDLYVGIAPPTLDGKRAKTMAISNAIGMYANASRLPVKFTANSKFKCEGASELEISEIASELFLLMNLEILQEYYNHRGEYFVLCRICDSLEEFNAKAEMAWNDSYNSDEDKETHELKASLAFILKDKDSELQGISTYYTDSNSYKDGIISCNGIDFTLPKDFEYTMAKDKSETSLFINTAASIGAAQTRLLYFLPFVPDSVVVLHCSSSDVEMNFEQNHKFRGSSAMLPHKLVMKDLYQDGLSFSFPTDMNGLKPRTFSDETAKKRWLRKEEKEVSKKYPEQDFQSYLDVYKEEMLYLTSMGYSDSYNVPGKMSIDALGFIAETLDNHIKPSYTEIDDSIKVSYSTNGRASFSLKNIVWGWDADFAVRRVNFDKISKYRVLIITDLNKNL